MEYKPKPYYRGKMKGTRKHQFQFIRPGFIPWKHASRICEQAPIMQRKRRGSKDDAADNGCKRYLLWQDPATAGEGQAVRPEGAGSVQPGTALFGQQASTKPTLHCCKR